MKKWALPITVLLAAFTLITQPSAPAGIVMSADTFGTSGNEFTIDFVNIGNAGNAADATGYGAVALRIPNGDLRDHAGRDHQGHGERDG